jgi:predicted short-subunit dehydrogenase-like oxidoreductase (DUF2520 family)
VLLRFRYDQLFAQSDTQMTLPSSRPRIAILGMGKLGRSLSILLNAAEYSVTEWSRGKTIPSDCEIYWVTANDSNIPEVANLIDIGSLVIHSSGSLGLDCLAPHSNTGSLHPLQSFPGPDVAMPNLDGVYAAVSGAPEIAVQLSQIASDLGMTPVEIDGDRVLYHTAAVLAGNFATTLLYEATEVLRKAGIPADLAPKMLAPLMISSIRQATNGKIADALTGPISRGDMSTISKHIGTLSSQNLDTRIYRLLAQRSVDMLVSEGKLSIEESVSIIRTLG